MSKLTNELRQVESTPNLAALLLHLARTSGVRGDEALAYLVARLRYHLEHSHGRRTQPVQPTKLKPDELAFIERRAWEIADAERNRLPPVRDQTRPAAVA